MVRASILMQPSMLHVLQHSMCMALQLHIAAHCSRCSFGIELSALSVACDG